MFEVRSATKREFDAMLRWLNADRETAALKYETIRRILIRFFLYRGCTDPESLADVTISRVSLKARGLKKDYSGEPARYFMAVGSRVYKEWYRIQIQENTALAERSNTAEFDQAVTEVVYSPLEIHCFDKCLQKLPRKNKEILLRYYKGDGTEKIKNRQIMAGNLGISTTLLSVRMFRIRSGLKACIDGCSDSADALQTTKSEVADEMFSA